MNLKLPLSFKSFSRKRLGKLFLLVFIVQIFVFCSQCNIMQISSSNSPFLGDFCVYNAVKNSYKNDSYANELINELSYYYISGSDALGAPDGVFSRIFSDYSSGLITLDMGNNEQILDGTGDDFNVIAGQGTYKVKVGNNLSQVFVDIGTAEGNQSFDLAFIGWEEARYIQIEYISGLYTEIDAIEAFYHNWIENGTDSTETNTSLFVLSSIFILISIRFYYKRKKSFK